MASPEEGEENSEPLKYTTWVLKVSIHCEGCKRKVKRILHSVEGVYTIDVNAKQHRVAVTGNVDAQTLLRKLEKSGKHAELWPNKYNINFQFDEQQQPPQQQQQQQQNEYEQNQQTQNDQNHPQNPSPQQQQQQQQNVIKEVRFDFNQPPPENHGGGDGGGGGGSGGGAKKKKKKKKSNSNNAANNNNSSNGNNNAVNNNNEPSQQQCGNPPDGGQPHTEPQQQPQQQQQPPQQQYMGPGPGLESGHYPSPGPGINRVYEYPPVYHAPVQQMCGVSYNTAYPRSYTSSYYSTPLPYSYSYAYTHQGGGGGGDVELSMPLDLSGPSLQPTETFEIFSDENPNACSVM